ncbi:MAG: hypothetical protein AMXMBFR58_01030 [Phycisphaerae bacterium]
MAGTGRWSACRVLTGMRRDGMSFGHNMDAEVAGFVPGAGHESRGRKVVGRLKGGWATVR